MVTSIYNKQEIKPKIKLVYFMIQHEPHERKSWEFESTTFTENAKKWNWNRRSNGMLANRDNDDVKIYKELLICDMESFGDGGLI